MKRRMFIKIVATAALFPAIAGGWLFRKVAAIRVIRAGQAKTYPGRIVPLAESGVSRPGRWNG